LLVCEIITAIFYPPLVTLKTEKLRKSDLEVTFKNRRGLLV
jgi:hypothetical protein